MSTLKLVLAELWHRKLSAGVAVLIIATATAAVSFFIGLADLAADRTRVIQRDIGLNVRVIPADTDLEQYWLRGYSDGAIDAELVNKLEAQAVANRLVPMLQRTIPWGDGEAILTGIGEEYFQGGNKKKQVFGGWIDDEQTVVLGQLAAERRGLKEGDSVEVLGQPFQVKRVVAASGSLDDIRVYGDLATVQGLLQMPGKLNEIRALECHCEEDIADPEQYLRETLEPLLPGTRVIRQDREADARRKQRQLADRIGSAASPVLMFLAVAGVFGLSFLNSHQRRSEVGLLAALGRSAWSIGLLVWLRAALLGVLGGVLGAFAGWWLVVTWADAIVGPGPGSVGLEPSQLVWGGLLGGGLASLGALVPAALAAKTDPATTLGDSP